MIENLKLVSEIFKKIEPAWRSCPQLQDKNRANYEDIMRVTHILEVFARPSKYDIYQLMVKAFSNWQDVQENSLKAIAEL